MGRRPTGNPRGRPPTNIVEICTVHSCSRLANARGLCKTHYSSLSRALKEGRPWDMETGKPVPSGYRPRSPFDPPELHVANTGRIDADTLAAVQAHVEVDAARVLPHVLAFCVAELLVRSGLTRNPDAVAAFTRSMGEPMGLVTGLRQLAERT